MRASGESIRKFLNSHTFTLFSSQNTHSIDYLILLFTTWWISVNWIKSVSCNLLHMLIHIWNPNHSTRYYEASWYGFLKLLFAAYFWPILWNVMMVFFSWKTQISSTDVTSRHCFRADLCRLHTGPFLLSTVMVSVIVSYLSVCLSVCRQVVGMWWWTQTAHHL